ncbi:M20/M25/M40 family metallo-hydrolase [Pseudarthrobacter sp. BRE9]|uniref:M20/M25/M40 family metallo-hydrolase n=1 Tax=Pseudarthrobacter sp. BRE9 TaxID=2962582 RepID=UPI00288229D7|nr:M20/M25/M40 family metallo-hydrolase [Pseudarthrobacter sp. BRE9]MDT0168198.1 M20/M25/M40 family metallo-hydrolase [Pseudarthrobacter sp. BRE9]
MADGQSDDVGHLRERVQSREAELERRLAEWVRVPGILGVPEHSQDLLRSATWLAAEFREVGFPVVDVLPTGESHAVYAEWCQAPGAPTVLVYSHHDVREVKPENWAMTAPFEPVLREGRLYGRGSSDAKGQILAHLEAVRAHLEETGTPKINLKFLIEGEEEGGSAHLAKLLEDNTERFAADLVLFSDTLLWHARHPAVCVSLRGMLSVHLEVYGPGRDVHSGAVSGNAPNPAFELGRLLGLLHDQDGRVAVPGFYDDVEPLPADLRDALADLPFSEEDWLARSETRAITGEKGYTVLERLWLRPAVEVTSIIAGDPLGVSRAAVPAVASADLSFRTVPGQRLEKIAEQLQEWVAATIGDTYGYSLVPDLETAQEPYRTPDHPAVAALEKAMALGFSAERTGRMGNAGGGPAELLGRTLAAPVLFFGTGLVEDHWHDSDECASLDVLMNGALTLACFWEELATMQWEKGDGGGHLRQ